MYTTCKIAQKRLTIATFEGQILILDHKFSNTLFQTPNIIFDSPLRNKIENRPLKKTTPGSEKFKHLSLVNKSHTLLKIS